MPQPNQASRPALRVLVLLAALLATGGVNAESGSSFAWGPEVGTEAPGIAALDQSGRARSLDDLGRENGLLFVFVRSADW